MYNKIVVIGYLGRDPERKGGDRGPVTFSVATSERWRSAEGQDKEETQWHEVTTWGKLADICLQILAKGDRALVEGSLEYNEHDGKKYARIKAREMKKLSPRREGSQPNQSNSGGWGQAQPQSAPAQGGWGQAQPQSAPVQGGWGQPVPGQTNPIQHKKSHVPQPSDDPIPF